MKSCPNCNAENPIEANFCRKCRYPFKPLSFLEIVKNYVQSFYEHIIRSLEHKRELSEFTLDKFNQLSLKPISTASVSFYNKFWVIIGCALLTFLIIFENFYEFRSLFRNLLGEYDYEILRAVVPYLLIPIAIIGICIIIWSYKKGKFRFNADYIETATFVGDTVRIARKCKLGLFNNKNNSVLLSSNYDNIEKFDEQHLMLTKNGKCGIYSLNRKSIIIPVVFDSISEFKNSVASAISAGNTIHFDIKGNRLR
ncbi:hypothetical protein [Bacteroides acidifaciens]|uniref:hypothetical protein n=1 Tax=Bacteroides acidifaciens TaxID=85831 RepID=UPI00262D8377|nr:hypothetical protein [Bacteroides acidifaciens]